MKKRNIKKIVIIIVIAIPVSILLYYLVPLIVGLQIDNSKYGFQEDKNISNEKPLNFIKSNEVKLSSSWSSVSGAFIKYYKYNSDQIAILELTQYQKIDINKMDIKNHVPPNKKVENMTFMGFPSKNYPYLFFVFYVTEVNNANIYIDAPIQKEVRNNNYIYLKFRTNLFAISGTNSYPQLEFSVPGKYIPFELLVLRKDNKVYFILKYPLEEKSSIDINDSLLDIINVE